MPARNKKTANKAAPKRSARTEDKLHTAQVRELVQLMVVNDLTSLEIVNGDLKVALGRGGSAAAGEQAALPALLAATSTGKTAGTAETPPEKPPAEAEAETLVEITSPMVGTFYRAPSPDSEPFVDVGARITAESVVCIVEAMKVLNEIKAECGGTIAEIVVTDGQPVEFGQVLFRVKP